MNIRDDTLERLAILSRDTVAPLFAIRRGGRVGIVTLDNIRPGDVVELRFANRSHRVVDTNESANIVDRVTIARSVNTIDDVDDVDPGWAFDPWDRAAELGNEFEHVEYDPTIRCHSCRQFSPWFGTVFWRDVSTGITWAVCDDCGERLAPREP